jgi:hypothetical protein
MRTLLISPHIFGIIACLLLTGLIVALGPYSSPEMFLEDQGALWYYWKLAEPDFWSRFSAWSLYALHQLGLWGLIAWAQFQRPGYTRVLHPVNLLALGFNLLFVLLHILQTRFFYDGLAQDTSVLSSQFSVIFMLVFILIMENRRRGLLFGYKFAFMEPAGGFLRRYHGYYFSWAVIYTFWFHPIEDNIGHLLGTFYILLLLLQGSLFFTRFHRDRVWTLLLEVFVLFHGAMVAWLSFQNDHWQMFAFGFLTLFILTQMHGVGLGRKARTALVAVYALCVILNYWGRGWDVLEVTRIPAAELGLAVLIGGAVWLALRQRRARGNQAESPS